MYIGFPYTAGLLAASIVHWHLWYAVVAVVLTAAMAVISIRRTVWKYVLISTLSMLTACCVYWGNAGITMQRQLALAGQEEIVFSGEITSISIYDSGYAQYILKGDINGTVPANVQYFCEDPSYAYGDSLTLTGIPQALQKRYVFDAEEYFRAQNVFLSMPMDAQVMHTERPHATLRSILYEWRQKMTERIQADRNEECAALLTGMLFGDKSDMSYSTRTALYRTGIGHVLAVSGLHMDFLALAVIRILRKCKADRRLSFGILAVLCVLFAICAGETVSVKRACMMILITQSAGLFFRKADILNTISIAMLLLTLENPMVIHSAAFWLSFSGTFGIAVFAPFMTGAMKRDTIPQRILADLVTFSCVFLAVLPASALYFREISLISPLSNLVIVPLCMAAFLLTALSVLVGAQGFLSFVLLGLAERIAGVILRFSRTLAELPWTHFGTDSNVLLVMIALSGIWILLCYALWRDRKLIFAAIAASLVVSCLACGTEQHYRNRNFHIAVLGEHRDCALVLRKGSDAVIVDLSGDSSAPDYVNAYLQSTGVRSIEALYLCEPKRQSIAGYDEILQFLTPEQVILLQEPEETLEFEIAGRTGILLPGSEKLFHGAVLNLSDGAAEVSCGGIRYVCCEEKMPLIPESEVLTIYGTSKNVLPESGILMVLDKRSVHHADSHTYIGENNLELAIAPAGKCSVRSLYGDT